MDLASVVESLADQIVERVCAKMSAGAMVRPRLLDVKQAAIYLGRTEKGIRELYKAGRLPSVKPDGRVQFDLHDLDRWIEQHKAA